MRTPLIRGLAGVVGALLVMLLVLPMAAASAATKNNLENGDEAWFLAKKEFLAENPSGEDPTCSLPSNCNVAGTAQRPSSHPENTLVVAANAGDPDAQTFINFDKFALPFGAVVTAGQVTLPVAQDPEAGNQRPEAATMVACMVEGIIPGGADGGSWADRPKVSENVCEPVKLTKKQPLTFSVDLKRFGKVWTDTTMNGISLMVDPKIAKGNPDPRETWRVVFNMQRRADQESAEQEEGTKEQYGYPAITWDLQYTVKKSAGFPTVDFGDTAEPSSGGDFATTGGDVGGGDFAAGSGGGDFATGGQDLGAAPPADSGVIQPPTDAGAPAVQEPVAAGDTAQQPVAAPAAVPANAVGLSPAVWAAPLVALALAGAFAWSLTQPVELAGAREGAVSKLMRTRRLAAESSSS